MTESERWQWFAYDHGWRQVLGLEKHGGFDAACAWYAPDIVKVAARYWARKLHRKPAKTWLPIPAADTVRPNWREIPGCYLTEAEHAIADPLITAMAAEARRNIKIFADRSRRIFAEPEPTPVAEEISPP